METASIHVTEKAATKIQELLAKEGVGLIYGGGSRGLMGAVATAVLDHGGHVTGVIPEFLQNREQTLKRAQEIVVTPDMHVRKQTMFERADAFVALPGGIGTLEEFFEVWTWRQLGYHDKPVGLLNMAGYYDSLLTFLGSAVKNGFMSDWQMELICTGSDAQLLLQQLVQAAGMTAATTRLDQI